MPLDAPFDRDSNRHIAFGVLHNRRTMATFVLVHGAMHGGWCWRDVRSQLARRGHEVFTPTLTGMGDRRHSLTPDVCVETHVADLADLLYFEDLRHVHLVLHSYAGILAGPLLDRSTDRVISVTLLGAFIVDSGQSLLDVEPPEVRNRYRDLADTSGGGWRIPAEDSFLSQWGLPDHLRPFVGARLTDFPLRCATDEVRYDSVSWKHIRFAYVRHTDPPLASLDHSYRRALQLGWRTFDIACGHDMMLQDPTGTADLLMEVVGQ